METVERTIENVKGWKAEFRWYRECLDKLFPYLFILSYLQSMVTLILREGCHGFFDWNFSILNLAVIAFWIYRKWWSRKWIEKFDDIVDYLEKNKGLLEKNKQLIDAEIEKMGVPK